MIGEYYGSLFSNLPGYSRNEYDIPEYLKGRATPMMWHGDDPDSYVGDAFAMALKASGFLNIARAAYGGGRTLGVFSSLKRPFNLKRQMWQANALKPKGILGAAANLAHDTGVDVSFKAKLWNAKHNILTGQTELPRKYTWFREILEGRESALRKDLLASSSQWGDYLGKTAHTMTPSQRRSFYAKWQKERYAIKKAMRGVQEEQAVWMDNALKYSGTMPKRPVSRFGVAGKTTTKRDLQKWMKRDHVFKPVLFERMFMKPGEFHLAVENVIGRSGVENLGGRDRIMSRYLKHMYAADQSTGFLKRTFGKVDRTAYRQFQKEEYVTLRNLVFGRKDMTRVKMVDEIFTPGGKRFSGWISNRRSNARIFNDSRTFIRDLTKTIGDVRGPAGTNQFVLPGMPAAKATEEGLRAYDSYVGGMIKRIGRARAVKFATFATVGVAVAASLAKTAYQQTVQGIARTTTTIHERFRADFGSGKVLQNSRLATERQRAIEAISNAQLNARYLLGNEAPLYHY